MVLSGKEPEMAKKTRRPKKTRTLEQLMREMKKRGAVPSKDGKSAAAGRD